MPAASEVTDIIDDDDDDAEIEVTAGSKVTASNKAASSTLDLLDTEITVAEDADDDDVCIQKGPASAAGRRGAIAAAASRRRTAAAAVAASAASAAAEPASASGAKGSKRKAVDSVDAEADVMFQVNSDSESSSSSGSSSARRKQRSGAAAAAALLTSQQALDIDEEERLIDRELRLPTAFAARWQHEGGMVAIMAELAVNISVLPSGDPKESLVRIAGTSNVVGKAVSDVQQVFNSFQEEEKQKKEKAESEKMGKVQVPSKLMSAVCGPNGSSLPEVRKKCGGVMLAMMPPDTPGGPLTVHIGPGTRAQISLVEKELRSRIAKAEQTAREVDALTSEIDQMKDKPSDGKVKPVVQDSETISEVDKLKEAHRTKTSHRQEPAETSRAEPLIQEVAAPAVEASTTPTDVSGAPKSFAPS
eukprot:TRINITY_DN8264_c0_g1_i1.p1 TRINITY_DN8264_c0_g1~~TRINITY_DN8264_c0_g1_i1.p1  ORF type:complete len:418 (+),score=127.09 TRINITY_DN8264_c0_g1_i1:68-1321(+)